MKATDALLLKGNASDAEAIQCSPGILRRTLPGWTTQAVWAPDSGQAYVYLSPPDRLHLDTVALGAQSQACRHLYPRLAGLSVSRLEKVFDVCGAAHAQSIHAHYVVEMDPEAGWMPASSAGTPGAVEVGSPILDVDSGTRDSAVALPGAWVNT